ncbi:hypothetical protein ACYATP_00165 [Lactobacillaceae bacterium Melli_B4]
MTFEEFKDLIPYIEYNLYAGFKLIGYKDISFDAGEIKVTGYQILFKQNPHTFSKQNIELIVGVTVLASSDGTFTITDDDIFHENFNSTYGFFNNVLEKNNFNPISIDDFQSLLVNYEPGLKLASDGTFSICIKDAESIVDAINYILSFKLALMPVFKHNGIKTL